MGGPSGDPGGEGAEFPPEKLFLTRSISSDITRVRRGTSRAYVLLNSGTGRALGIPEGSLPMDQSPFYKKSDFPDFFPPTKN